MRIFTFIFLGLLSSGMFAQKAFIQIESLPGVSVTLDTTYIGETSPTDGVLRIEDLSPGLYEVSLQHNKTERKMTISIVDDNERVWFIDMASDFTENRSPVNRPSKYALLDYRKMNVVYDTMTDSRDKNTYLTLNINGQIWMAENMNYEVKNESFIFPKDSINEDAYGRLYTWNGAVQACPAGWRLPTDEDWKSLEEYVGMRELILNSRGWRDTQSDSTLKSAVGWLKSTGANDEFGFSAMPGGYFDEDFIFCCEGYYAYFWTATEGDEWEAWYRVIAHDIKKIGRFCYDKRYGFSVRCIKE